eukprot:CAMPEP_0119049242 /NCGR_PEP_ID=MMETSP1177-20130426/63618_1 /TAXON_ID=2985 /ORGANISM="Ochromonas sp, Strain CCMP1899" /LENGTH=39 /DNA_ID= /DNA_START= /DNA_END= /DNA_ORIENTATION=
MLIPQNITDDAHIIDINKSNTLREDIGGVPISLDLPNVL